MILAAALKGFFAIFSMVVAAIVVAIFLAIRTTHWVSQRMANALSFFSLERFRNPPPLLSQGDALAMQGDVGGAFHLFRQFLKEHPRNLEIYSRLIDLSFGPMQDAEIGDAIIAFGKKRLDRRGRRVIRERRNAIVLGQLYPLKHLGWRKMTESEHPKVEIPEALKGQFAPPSS
ncbi:MAG: hypothetical protein ACJAT6_000012 [Akkermansiaceae bacterium]|jgi:hypothetical protein|tara:strand:- start:4206 stop:4727 length:522 start_codon:yes stop_codon:yes gene_type:complete